jgi:hypothetical protein
MARFGDVRSHIGKCLASNISRDSRNDTGVTGTASRDYKDLFTAS